MGKRIFGTVDAAPEVGIHQPAKHVQIDVVEQGTHRDPGIVDQNIDTPEFLYGSFDQPFTVLLAGDVAGNGESFDG